MDADSLVSPEAIQSALRSRRDGCIGGGCMPRFDGPLPWWCRGVYPPGGAVVRLIRQPGGCCLFCIRAAYEATGGFSEAHYAAEDAVFASALKRQGWFVVQTGSVITSGRKLREHSFWSITRLLLRVALRGPNGFRDRRSSDFWCRTARENKCIVDDRAN